MSRAVFAPVGAAFETLNQVVALLDEDLRIVEASPAFRGFVGSSNVEGRNIAEFVDGEAVQRRLGRLPDGVFDEPVRFIIALEFRENGAGRNSGDERERMQRALEEHRWRRSAAARALGISRATLWRRMRDYGLL